MSYQLSVIKIYLARANFIIRRNQRRDVEVNATVVDVIAVFSA